jgi:hypothetical protein
MHSVNHKDMSKGNTNNFRHNARFISHSITYIAQTTASSMMYAAETTEIRCRNLYIDGRWNSLYYIMKAVFKISQLICVEYRFQDKYLS